MSEVKRPYHSRRRAEQAEETRRRILTAARRLFVHDGYGATTIDAVAREAGVSAPTVYAGFKSKQGILLALLDAMATDADRALMEAAVQDAAGDPQQQLHERIAFTTRFYAGGADLIEIARTVSGVEPDLRAMWMEGEARRHRAAAALVAEWDDAGVLAPGLSRKEATDVMWGLCGPDVFRLLTVERRWSRKRYEAWLEETLAAQLFRPASGGKKR